MIWSLGFERGAVHQCSKWSYVNEPNRSTRSLWTNLWVSRLTTFFKNPVAIIQLWNWHHFNPRTARRSWTEAFVHDPWSLWWISKECEYCLSTLSPSWSTLELDATGFQVIVRCLLHLFDSLVQGVVVVILIPIGFMESILQSLDDCLLGFDHRLHLLVFEMKDCCLSRQWINRGFHRLNSLFHC